MNRVISEERRAEVVALYRNGYSLREIARRSSMSTSQARLIVKTDAPELMRKPFDTRSNSTFLGSTARARQ